MPSIRPPDDPWAELTGADIDDWTGARIADRGRSYQRDGHVSEMARLADGSLIAWVDGTERYATHVFLEDDIIPLSLCTCPYGENCKHAVALVIDYQKRVRKKQRIPQAAAEDIRLRLLGEDCEEEMFPITEDVQRDIERFLTGATKTELVALVRQLNVQFPQVARALYDRQQLASGNADALVARLREEIFAIADRPGWQNYWNKEGFTPDFSAIRRKIATLLEAGHADAVLSLGRDLVATGTELIETSDDHGETAGEVASCMPLIAMALEKSSLDAADKLDWAVEVERADDYEICEPLVKFLNQRHPRSAWSTVADRLLVCLENFKATRGADTFTRSFERGRLSGWVLHALEGAGRREEIIPLCETEARKTGRYDRLVDRLIEARRYRDAERWIHEGLKTTDDQWQGRAFGLRDKLLEIRRREKNWPAVAAILVEKFIRRPSLQGFTECQKGSGKVKAWPEVRRSLLDYLENGKLPWDRNRWPLPETGLEKPEIDPRRPHPMLRYLIAIAIEEKKPAGVLKWYDRRAREPYSGHGIDDDAVAVAVQNYAPERSVEIWKAMAERLIARVKPSAYKAAAQYLRKAARVVQRLKKDEEWQQYLQTLRQQHFRKRRLLEILDEFD